ncbi:hypothetical protein C8F01DRAFT_701635 [Mycena amicta]|nr:hypothetical protein C8F01DRAFT_701635 [Mycena amicta]
MNSKQSLSMPFPQTPHTGPRFRSASAACTPARRNLISPPPSSDPSKSSQTDKHSKRHTYHELGLPNSHPNPWNRVVSLPQASPSHPSQSRAAPPVPFRPHRLDNIDPRPLLRALNALLDPATQRIPDFLDVDHLVALYERDAMEREQRDTIKVRARLDRARNRILSTNLTVFGSSLRETTMYASMLTVLCGFEHDIPIVVFLCVKELCRHGFSPNDRKPDRDRLLALISEFDTEPQFGSKTAFNAPYELAEIYGLLTTYLFALPEPILSSEMFEAMWTWCIVPSLRSTDFMEEGHIRKHEPSDASINIAHILLRLLPIPNFSLVVYLMGFFQRLPHLASEDVGRAVFAGKFSKTNPVSDGRAERVPIMLRWLVDHWDLILKALFDSPQAPSVSRLVRVPTKETSETVDRGKLISY